MTHRLGPFDLTTKIGQGGMGEVWEGIHRTSGMEVAVKVITADRAREDVCTAALRREVEAVARLHHPNIVDVHDFGEIPGELEGSAGDLFRAGSPYLVLERLPGTSLATDAPSDWATLRQILSEILDALAHAHARGVIHRDLKPANILLRHCEAGPRVALTDFGVARALDTAKGNEGISGTPRYMAPEQVLGRWRDQGPWTDLYAVGCLAFRLTTGEPPFSGVDRKEIFARHLEDPVPPMDSLIAVPAEFEQWVRQLLAKEPERRFRRAADAMYRLGRMSPATGDDDVDSGLFPTLAALGPPSDMAGAAGGGDHTTITDETRPDDEPAPADDTDERLPDSAVLARPSVSSSAPQPPPFAPNWRRREPTRSTMPTGIGLGIFGLRTIPMVDRNPERDLVWEALRDVHEDGRARTVVLRGSAGTGKSRLARWMCERAEELGGATVLSAFHSPIHGPADGIPRMLASHFQCVGLDHAQTFERLKRSVVGSGDATWEDLHLAAGLAEIVASGEKKGNSDVPRVTFASPAERFGLLYQLLRRMTDERPVVVWIDDAQWGTEALAFCQHVLRRNEDDGLPVLLLLTVRDDLLSGSPHEEQQLEQLRDADGVEFIAVRPLQKRHQAKLVRKMLGLEPSLADRVVALTGGNPLFAVQLIEDWVERERLEPDEAGFRLADPAEELPADLTELWERRIIHLLAPWSDDEQCSFAREALEIAAALGQAVDREEWEAACSVGDVVPPSGLLDRMVALGMAERREDGWAFAHGLLRETLKEASEEEGRWEAQHRRCAAMLAEQATAPETKRRLGRHLHASQDFAGATEPLIDAARHQFDLGNYKEAESDLDLAESGLDALQRPEDDLDRARIRVMRARIFRELTLLDEALEELDEAQPVAEQNGADRLLGRIFASRAALAAFRGNLEQGFDHARDALSRYRAVGDRHGEATVHRTLNWLHLRRGELDESMENLDAAREIFEDEEDVDGLGWVHYEMSTIAFERGDLEEAKRLNRRSAEIFTRLGSRVALSGCLNLRGEFARFEGDLEAAETNYRAALDYYETVGHSNAVIVRENLALTLMARDEFTQARRLLEGVLDEYERVNLRQGIPRVLTALIAAAAGEDDWERWDQRMDRLTGLLADNPYYEADLPANLERAAELAASAGHVARAKVALRLAIGQWRALKSVDRRAEAEEKLEGLAEN